jgi:hypothetical protein
MAGIVSRYQHLTGKDFARTIIKKFIDKKIVYLTGALSIGIIQVYFTDGNENLLDVSNLNTKLLDANTLFSLQASPDWSGEYDPDSGVYRIVFPTEKSGIVVYVAQFEDVN